MSQRISGFKFWKKLDKESREIFIVSLFMVPLAMFYFYLYIAKEPIYGVPQGAVEWKLLKTDNQTITDKAKLQSLAGTEVKIYGYMFPVKTAKKSNEFIIGQNSMTCPFCSPNKLDQIVLATMAKQAETSMRPVLVEGKFELLKKDDDSGLLYKITDAKLLQN